MEHIKGKSMIFESHWISKKCFTDKMSCYPFSNIDLDKSDLHKSVHELLFNNN